MKNKPKVHKVKTIDYIDIKAEIEFDNEKEFKDWLQGDIIYLLQNNNYEYVVLDINGVVFKYKSKEKIEF